MPKEWRVLVTESDDIALLMARDEALLETVEYGSSPVIHFSTCTRPAMTLGRFQDVGRTVRFDMVERELLPVTRRISGGRAILHGDDLIVTVAARCEEIGLPNTGSVRMIEIYHRLAEVFLFAFEELGIEAELGNSTPIASQSSLGDCFALTTGVDIQERSTGNKLLGAALFRRGDMFLEQVSVPLRSPEHHEAQIALGDRVFFGGSGLGEVACGFSRSSLMSRILGAIQNVLAVTVVEMGFTSEEHSSAIRYRRLRYNSTDWIRKGVFSSQITD